MSKAAIGPRTVFEPPELFAVSFGILHSQLGEWYSFKSGSKSPQDKRFPLSGGAFSSEHLLRCELSLLHLCILAFKSPESVHNGIHGSIAFIDYLLCLQHDVLVLHRYIILAISSAESFFSLVLLLDHLGYLTLQGLTSTSFSLWTLCQNI